MESTNYIPRTDPNPSINIIVFAIICILLTILAVFLEVSDSQKGQHHEPEGCRKLGVKAQSNLADEHNECYAKPEGDDGETTWRVKSLWMYPIKSCTGVELDRHTVTGSGMEYDRRFCFAQLLSEFPARSNKPKEEKAPHRWKFITQRSFPAMARIKTEIWVPDPSSPSYSPQHSNVQSGGILVIKFPSSTAGLVARMKDMFGLVSAQQERTIHVPFNPTSEQISKKGYFTQIMNIWKDNPASLLIASTENSDAWMQDLRYYLGITNHLALFRVSTDQSREVYRCAPRRDQLGYQSTVGFQDAYPLHLLNLASVHDVASKMKKDAPRIGARNFRPNIVITGGDAYAEDSWKLIRVGGHEYHVSCRTVRCLLPNVDPATGVRHGSEPNRTLKSFRRIDEGDPNNACLGMQMVPAAQHSSIEVGDSITVFETGKHLYIKQ